MQDFEKLGAFYLGREYDMAAREGTMNNVLYDSRDLCTHAVVVGMTGSGKTGLCVGLLEEAGMDNIPSIVIDPKGDISNLLLTFPNLTPEEFRPWIDEGQAARKGVTPAVFATNEADKWKAGLAKWGQDGERIRKLRSNVEMRVYTPGSTAGRPMTILKSFSAPSEQVINDSEALLDRVSSATSGLLALLGIDADPIRSREHILISKILENAWTQSRDMDLGKLIGEIQTPPFERVGIMEIDAFFPKKDRQELAMTLNNLLASPTFSSWLEGEPLDIKKINEVLSWMRSQPGTSSLRAMLYMDEVYGYFPPTANPPSKKPMLTLLKQARAFGLGCVLATQNPVDLDYKGLSNAGTWFLGRLQTERDKARVLEGLEGASTQAGSKFNRGEMEKTLAGLGSRVFLMNNVHDDEPVVFETRWVMSYLRGPLTRNQLQDLVKSDPNYDPEKIAQSLKPRRPASEPEAKMEPQIDQRQLVPDDVRQIFVEPQRRLSSDHRLIYRPSLLGRGRLHFVKSTYDVDQWEERTFLASVTDGQLPNEIWDEAEPLEERLDFENEAEEGVQFAKVPSDLQKAKNFKTWNKELKEFLYRGQKLDVWKCVALKQYSEPGETLGDFKVRLEQMVSEKRDDETDKLRKKYASKFSTLRGKIRRAEDKLELEEDQYKQSRMSSVLSVGSTLMGALLGRKSTRNASSSMRSMGRQSKEKADIARAKDNLEDLQVEFEDMEHAFNDEVDELTEKLSIENLEFDDLQVTPRKSDISIEEFAVCWLPWRVDSSGIAEPIY